MRLKKGQVAYPLKPHSLVCNVVVLNDDGMWCAVQLVKSVVRSNPGLPRLCVVTPDMIVFDPPPDKNYKALVRYAPPIREM